MFHLRAFTDATPTFSDDYWPFKFTVKRYLEAAIHSIDWKPEAAFGGTFDIMERWKLDVWIESKF